MKNNNKWIKVLLMGIVCVIPEIIYRCLFFENKLIELFCLTCFSAGVVICIQQMLLFLFSIRTLRYRNIIYIQIIATILLVIINRWCISGYWWVEMISSLLMLFYICFEINGVICLCEIQNCKKRMEEVFYKYIEIYQIKEKTFNFYNEQIQFYNDLNEAEFEVLNKKDSKEKELDPVVYRKLQMIEKPSFKKKSYGWLDLLFLQWDVKKFKQNSESYVTNIYKELMICEQEMCFVISRILIITLVIEMLQESIRIQMICEEQGRPNTKLIMRGEQEKLRIRNVLYACCKGDKKIINKIMKQEV